MNTESVAVTFANRHGHRLFGIVHEPAVDLHPGLAILLLSPGVKSRVGPHRLYAKMTRRFLDLGFRVLRFDFCGLGDSEGEAPEALLADLYRQIQLGRYVEDTKAAMGWMKERYGTSRFVLGGLCGGALTGLLTAQSRRDVEGLLALGLPVMLDGSDVDKVRAMTTGQLQSVRDRYLRKLRDPQAWLRLLTLRSNFRLLARALTSGARRSAESPSAGPQAASSPAKGRQAASNANPLVAPAFERTLSQSCRMLLLFSESDRLYWEFREKFYDNGGAAILGRHGARVEIDFVPKANHVFTFSEWQAEMLDKSGAWLSKHFPPAAGHLEPSMPLASRSETA